MVDFFVTRLLAGLVRRHIAQPVSRRRSHVAFQVALGCSLFLLGCQTPRYKAAQEIKPGMNKSDVLETAGGPNTSERCHDQDCWQYKDPYAPQDSQVREVRFSNGQAVYVGPPIKPKVSAEEQDRLNAEADAKEAAANAEAEQQHQKLVGGVRADPSTHEGSSAIKANPNALDADDRRLQESLYGTSNEQEAQKIAPHFEVIE